MARQLTKELALKIVKKLSATRTKKSKKHQFYDVLDDHGRVIVSLGVRRGSERDLGHDHLQDQLYVNTYVAKGIASCTVTRDDWIQALIEQGDYG